MNRTIKFRAFDKIRNKMLHFTGNPYTRSEYNELCWEVDEEEEKDYYGCLKLRTDNMELMQYTGLKDKNGKEIYGGDILRWKRGGIGDEFIISIHWDWTGANWQFDDYTSFDDGIGLGNWDFTVGIANDSEVIGNIYENPELTK